MDPDRIFDLNQSELDNYDFMFQNLDSFDSLFDLNKLDDENISVQDNNQKINSESNSNDSNDQFLNFFIINNNPSPDSSNELIMNHNTSPSPFNDSSSTSSLTSSPPSSNSIISLDTSVLEKFDFSKTKTGPVTIKLPETENNGMKITSEIILNFDQLDNIDEKQLLDQYEMLKADETENLNVLSNSSNDTCIDLNEPPESPDDDDLDKIETAILTEEEKTVYLKEGYQLPTHTPLTKSEEKVLKLVRRKIRNKKSAHNSRERKKKYVDGLEKRVDMCTKENEQLHKQVRLLQTKNTELMAKFQNLQAYLSTLLNKHKKSSTAVLFVSFFITFCVYPYLDISDTNDVYALKTVGFSRTLLSNDINLSNEASSLYDLNNTQGYDYIWDFYKSRYDI